MNEREAPRTSRREVIAWALYDFANSAFATLVVTFIFSAYFAQKIATDPLRGTILWSRAINISAFLAAVSTPLLGAIADARGRKKWFLLLTTLQCVLFTALLFFVGPGQTVRGAIFFILANFGFEAAYVFYNAFLPEISTKETIGRISGAGQALGYVGGLLALGIALVMIRGGLPAEAGFNIRATNLLAAVWLLVFSIPIFLVLREPRKSGTASWGHSVGEGFRRLATTLRRLRDYREAAKLLIARMVYNDGLVTVFSFAAIFASAAFGMSTERLIVMGLAINLAAGIGSFALGFVNDRIGGKKTIAITLVVLIITTLVGAFARSVTVFWVAAMLLGLMVGPNQSASRSLLGLFVPEDKHAEFFGFFSFSGKLASMAGPFFYGTILELTGSQRWAMASIVVFFVAGLILLAFVNEQRGIAGASPRSA